MLMQRVAEGDQHVIQMILQQHLPRIYNLAYRIAKNEADAEEISQEAFLKLWQQSTSWKANAQISTWLYRVAYNLSIDLYRKTRLHPSEDVTPDIMDHQPSPQTQLEHSQRQKSLQQAIDSLPERQKIAVTLVYQQEMSQKQASLLLNISLDAFESLLSRGRRALRQALMSHKQDMIG